MLPAEESPKGKTNTTRFLPDVRTEAVNRLNAKVNVFYYQEVLKHCHEKNCIIQLHV